VTKAEEVGGSIDLTIEAPRSLGGGIAPKGSIALDGVSLTVNEVEDAGEVTRFTINLIPHTADHTTLGGIAAGRKLNLEIDVLARYLRRMSEARM
jgi:riboflavin synthase